MTVAEDAGLTPGNAHAVLIADFPDAEAYSRYAQAPVHQAVIAEHVRPHLAARIAQISIWTALRAARWGRTCSAITAWWTGACA